MTENAHLFPWDSCIAAALDDDVTGLNVQARFPAFVDWLTILLRSLQKTVNEAEILAMIM